MTAFDKFLRKYIFRIIGASLAGGLHLLLLTIVGLTGGKGAIFLLGYIDFPIVYLWQVLIGPVGTTGGGFLLFLCFLIGTLMYALAGWLIGWIGDWLRQSSQKG